MRSKFPYKLPHTLESPEEYVYILHIIKDVMVVFREAFHPSICLSHHPSMATAWRIFKFDMHERFPTVECLQNHLPNQQMVLFDDDDDVQEVAAQSAISRTMIMEWFKTNQESKVAGSLTFNQFPQQWVWN